MKDDELPPNTTAQELEALKLQAKEALRKRVAALRRALTAEARAERARAMCAQLIAHEAFARAQVVSGYAPMRFEIDPSAALAEAHALGKGVVLPRVHTPTRELHLHYTRAGDELVESGFMVREPLETAPVAEPSSVDLVLVPGLSFDARGRRLGYGQGFYDRLLPLCTRAVRIGLAFDFQLLAEVPAFEHDAPVDYVVTDRRVLRCER